MEDFTAKQFPLEFGASPEEFLSRYESLIYKVIYERTTQDHRLEAEDLFQSFFLHLAEEDFRRLRSFSGKCLPTTYLGKILRNFICDQYRKKGVYMSSKSLEELQEDRGESITIAISLPENPMTSKLTQDSLRAMFSKLSNRERLIFDFFVDRGMSAREIAHLLGMKIKAVYKSNEKIKKILREELKKRGVDNIS